MAKKKVDITVKELRLAIKKDSEYKKYLKVVDSARSHTNFENNVAELESMHGGRLSRRLFITKEYSVKKLSECIIQDASYRSRCVEIRIIVNKHFRLLTASTEYIKSYLYARYKAELASLYSTKGDREHFVRTLISDASEIVSDFERVEEIAKFVIDDIDKFGWSAKHIIDGLTILYKKDHAS